MSVTVGKPWKPRQKRAGAASGVMPLHTISVCGRDRHERFPGAIVYVRQCAKWIRAFRRFCELNHMAVVIKANENSGKQVVVCKPGICWEDMESTLTVGAWEVLGSPEHLDALTRHPLVMEWHPVLALKVPVQGSGAGPDKIITRKKHKDPVVCRATELDAEYRVAIRDGEYERAKTVLGLLGRNKKERA